MPNASPIEDKRKRQAARQWIRVDAEEFRRRMSEAAALRRILSRAEEYADGHDLHMQDLLREGCVADQSRTCGRRATAVRHQRRQDESHLRRLAEVGVASLRVEPLCDGAARVSVAGSPEFLLPETLAALLSALALDGNAAAGVLVAWKPLPQLADLLAKRLQRPFKPHAVVQLISRLRQAMYFRGGVNPWLVQTRPRYGARFALKRPADTPQ